MNDLTYTNKYTKLLQKLTDFILGHGKEANKFPDHASFVAFSATDLELNKYNEQLLELLKKEDKPIIKAEEPKSIHKDWKFTVITP